MAMFSGPMMPPPKTIDKEVGERRLTNWTPVGISLCEELDVGRVLTAAGTEDKEKLQQVRARVVWHAHKQAGVCVRRTHTMCVCVCVCVCVCARARACVRAHVRACTQA